MLTLLALKIHVSTQKGYLEGVPRILELLDKYHVFASFFFSMGPEESLNLLGRVMGKQPDTIVGTAPGILREASKRGHDCGIYAWNPSEWIERLEKIPPTTLETQLKKARDTCTQRIGHRPYGFASPGWHVSDMSLRVADELTFEYCSDTLGLYPFIPKFAWKTFDTPQIPTTVPPLETIWKDPSITDERFASGIASSLREGLNVISLDAGREGGPKLAAFDALLARCRDAGISCIDLHTVAQAIRKLELPVCEIITRPIEGLPQSVAVQIPTPTDSDI